MRVVMFLFVVLLLLILVINDRPTEFARELLHVRVNRLNHGRLRRDVEGLRAARRKIKLIIQHFISILLLWVVVLLIDELEITIIGKVYMRLAV